MIEDGATKPENQEPDDRRGALDAAQMCRDRKEGGTGEGGLIIINLKNHIFLR